MQVDETKENDNPGGNKDEMNEINEINAANMENGKPEDIDKEEKKKENVDISGDETMEDNTQVVKLVLNQKGKNDELVSNKSNEKQNNEINMDSNRNGIYGGVNKVERDENGDEIIRIVLRRRQ